MLSNPKLVIDVSRYDFRLDVPLLKSAGVEAVIVKSGQGIRRDSKFVSNGQAVVDGGLQLMAYYWDDIILDPGTQARWAVNDIAATGLPVKFLWADQEQWWSDWDAWSMARKNQLDWSEVPNASPGNISLHNRNFTEALAKLFPQTGMYTNFGFVSSWASPMKGWIGNDTLWVAHYGRQPKQAADFTWDQLKGEWLPDYEPLTPPGTNKDRLVGHQFTGDKFRLPGVYDMLGRKMPLDVSVFTGDFIQNLVNSQPIEKPEEPPQPELPPADASAYFVNVTALNIRKGPGAENAIIGSLTRNATVKVVEMSGKWAHLDSGGWVYALYLSPIS